MYDLIILGGGPAGYNAAERAGHAGLKTLVIEERALGGVCLNEGCIPTKTLLYSAKIYDYAKHGKDYGVTFGSAEIDHAFVVERKNGVVKQLVAGVGAKELVVSTLGVMYTDEGDVASGDTRLQRALVNSVSPAAALAYMVFILLYFPCIATFVAIRNESGKWKWALITAVYTIVLAWIAAFITFHIASLFL